MTPRLRSAWFSVAAIAFVLSTASISFAATVVIQMTSVNFTPTFVPAEVSIRPGDTVRWINADPFLLDHATCSGTGSADPLAGSIWNSGSVRTGESYEFTFPTIGDFAFFSIPHEFQGMFGMVHVTSSLETGEIETSTWGRVKALFRDVLPRE